MSASLVVDLFNTTLALPSITDRQLSGQWPGSGAVIGNVCDLLYANTLTNVYCASDIALSGQIRIAIQCSDTTASGSFTDPTSGVLANAGLGGGTVNVQSGGLIYVNSGGAGLFSGAMTFAAFQRPQRYARAVALSGFLFDGGFQVGFIANLKQTSGQIGSTQSPGSGTVSV